MLMVEYRCARLFGFASMLSRDRLSKQDQVIWGCAS
jgi:hypothetical protein